MHKEDIIKNKEDIENIKRVLIKVDYKIYLLFMLAIDTGIPINQIICLKARDILQDGGKIREFIVKSNNKYIIGDVDREYLCKYLESNFNMQKLDNYLFKGHRGNMCIDESEVYRILNVAATKIGINVCFKTHTLRKTYGYHFYMENDNNIRYLKKLFNHATEDITADYIGIKLEQGI